jgi:uncharacterized protein
MPRLNLVPRERLFNELFSRQGQLVKEALAELSASLNDESSHHAVLRELEHRCDDVTHEIYKLTNRTFVPPFERADILTLAHSLDEIVDLAEESADKIDLYHVESITDAAKSMGRCLAEAGSQIASAADKLVDGKDLVEVLEEIHRLENEGDHITRQALQRLFETNHRTAADLIKWKDLYALLESTLDECESAAEIMESINIK